MTKQEQHEDRQKAIEAIAVDGRLPLIAFLQIVTGKTEDAVVDALVGRADHLPDDEGVTG